MTGELGTGAGTAPPSGPAVRTAIPGPESRRLLGRQARRESAARTYPRRLPIAMARGYGSYLEDVDGNVFLDFLTGAGSLPLGHSHPEIAAVVRDQLGLSVQGLDLPSPVKDAFTRQQIAMLPPSMRDRMRVHFAGPTGANAVEAAIKLCKTATGRPAVIAFQGAFHGSTAAAMAVSGSLAQKAAVPGGMPGVQFMPYPYCLRCPLGLTVGSCDTNCAGLLDQLLRDPLGGVTKPAAVILELIQGEGGVIPAPPSFARRLREVTTDLGVPLIVDEVQTGCGRTGTWLAVEQYGIEPDVIVMSKGLSGFGLPVALILYQEWLDVWLPGAHTGTFRGNQLAFAGGSRLIELFQRDDILAGVRLRGSELAERLDALRRRHPAVAQTRGRGLMWGAELADPRSGQPDGALARAVQRACLERGLIVEVGGREDSVVRFLPPLNVSAAEIAIAADILDEALAAVSSPAPAGRGREGTP
jgi:diaminobutyrate-2-oxoglutarate transaminase